MPEKATRPSCSFGGSCLTDASAPVLAAAGRLGLTSVAAMDSETSMASMIVARSLGTFRSSAGRARLKTEKPTMDSSSSAAGMCRRYQAGRRRATDASSESWVKRAV